MTTWLSALLVACTGGTLSTGGLDDTGVDTEDPLTCLAYGDGVYDKDRFLAVEVTLDPDDWEELRNQARNFLDMITGDECLADPWESPFTWFPADVTIDGVTVTDVQVRKKGLLGSVVPDRPSLKISFDRTVEGQRFEDVERLTLNNQRQDGSRIKTCQGYWLYEDAGLPGSRCNYAHVTVNGEDLGVYANVEPVKKDMLRRVYGNDDGNLYEGTLSDFLDGWTGTFDDKTDASDRADLTAAAEALETEGDGFEAAADAHFVLDEFLRYWAMESLIGHWDSYSGNRNNFYVYADPDSDGRFRFLPWGIDAILEGEEPFGQGRPTTITGTATLPQRILEHPDLVDRYEAHLRDLLDTVWDEERLHDRVDAADDLTAPYAWPDNDDGGWRRDTIQNMHDFVDSRRDQVADEWDDRTPDPSTGEPREWCLEEVGTIDILFETTQNSYGTQNTWSYGDATWDFQLDGEAVPLDVLGSVVGEYDGLFYIIFSADLGGGYNVAVYVYSTQPELMQAPGTVEMDWSQAVAYLIVDTDGDFQNWDVGAYLGGSLTLDEASASTGSPWSGQFQLEVFGQ